MDDDARDDQMTPDERLDPRLAAQFEELMGVPAPDTWSQVGPAPLVELPRRFGPQLLAAAAVVLAVVGLTAAVLVLTAGDDTTNLATLDRSTDEDAGTTTDEGDGGDTADRGTADGGDLPAGDPPAECVATELAASLGRGLPTFDYEPSESARALALASPRAVRGQLLDAHPADGGTILDVKILDALGPDGERIDEPLTIWTPARVPEGELNGDVVAFFTGSLMDGGRRAWAVDIEGLWVACDTTSPAVSVIVEPTGAGWEELLAAGVSLDELWEIARWPTGERTRALEAPSVVEDGAAVYDLRLFDGGRFRLSLPEALAEPFTVRERPAPESATIEGARTTITVAYEVCGDDDAVTENELGSVVARDDAGIRFCRPDDAMVTTVRTDAEVANAALDAFDLRPIEPRLAYFDALAARRPDPTCTMCTPFGPALFPELGVAVHRTAGTSVTGVELDTLATRWTADPGGVGVTLIWDFDALYVDAAGADFWRLDPATGEEIWRVDRTADERAGSFTGHGGEVWLLRTSFSTAGDARAPLLRRVDPATGEVLWTATGRQGTDWQWAHPVVVGGMVVLMDVVEEDHVGAPQSSALLGFDADSGELAWTTELFSSIRAFSSELVVVAELEDGPALLARTLEDAVFRIDPAAGEVLWRSPLPGGIFGGTDYGPDGRLAIEMLVGRRGILLDPATGARIDERDTLGPFECPVTDPDAGGFVPPEPWPSTPSVPDAVWYGTEELWTILELEGHNPRKSVWWSVNFPGGSEEGQPPLEVTYQRLDSGGAPVVYPSPGTNAYTVEDDWFMINGIEPADAGCWRATASYKGTTLSYVYEIR